MFKLLYKTLLFVNILVLCNMLFATFVVSFRAYCFYVECVVGVVLVVLLLFNFLCGLFLGGLQINYVKSKILRSHNTYFTMVLIFISKYLCEF